MQCYVQENLGVNVVERDFEKYSSLREFAKFVEENRNSDVENKTMNISWAEIIGRLPQPKLYKPNCLHFLSIFIFKTFGKLFYRTEYIGLENLKTDKPVIIAPNHQSYLDGLFVIMPFSKTQLYKTYFFAKLRNILKGGLLKKYADRSNVIIMDINDNVSEALRKLATALREGNRIVIFPEGTRTKDGLIADFKQSFAILAKEMNVEVIPVAISGAYEAVKANATLPTFGAKAIVEYLPAMSVKENESYADFAIRVKEAIEKAWDKNTKRD
jgi:long-chain acyl-CoA synthetase